MKQPPSPKHKFVTAKATADRIGVSEKTVRRWIASSELPAHRLGRSVRIAEADLQAFLALRRTT